MDAVIHMDGECWNVEFWQVVAEHADMIAQCVSLLK